MRWRGIENYAVQPQNRDELGKRVKTERLDLPSLWAGLDRSELVNSKVFRTDRNPTLDKVWERALGRQHKQLEGR